MRIILLTLSIVLPLASNTLALPTTAHHRLERRLTTAELEAITDTDLFSITIDAFEALRDAEDPPELDWSSDGCTDSPDEPLGFDFLPSCQRHDFGYRNYKSQGRFTAAAKARIDLNFKSDLDNECATADDTLEKDACLALAELYYEAVKELGSK